MIEIKTGLKIGKLTVLKEGERKILPGGIKPRTVDCICDCGNTKNVLLLHFIRNRTLSCGCIKRTQNGISNTKLYRIYRGIKERCDGKTKDAERYLGRGIVICDEWKNDPSAFVEWSLGNGYEEGLQIDRENNDLGYSPENCRWATSIVNANNKENTFRVSYLGEIYPFKDLCRKLNKNNAHNTIRRRIKAGWTVENAFDTPIRKGNYSKRLKNTIKKSV